jgi:hypothetical protein
MYFNNIVSSSVRATLVIHGHGRASLKPGVKVAA